MSSAERIRESIEEGARTPGYLGPGEVVAPRDELDARRFVDVRLPSGRIVRAAMALALPYEAARGDVLLVLGGDDAHYVVGVLSGSGKTVLEAKGDLDLRAVGGAIRLESDRAVRIDAPEVEIVADRIRRVAGAVVDTLGTLAQRVRELATIQAGHIHTRAEGTHVAQAKATTLLSEDKVTINGKAVHLG
jgi:hypothetical protein